MASIRQIATIAGVSTSTVSLALRDDSRVRLNTRERIQAIAAQYHYRPNRLTQSLISGTSKTLGCILPSVTFTFYTRLLRGVLEQAFTESYRVIPIVTDWQFENIRPAIHTLIEQRVDSILIADPGTVPIPRETIIEMISHNIVPVALDSTRFESPVDEVSTDEPQLAETAVEYLYHLGHREIAYIGSIPDLHHLVRRPRAIYDALRKWRISTAQMLHFDFTPDTIVHIFTRLRQASPSPTAVICLDDGFAAMLLQHAAYQGVHIPHELSILGCANLELMQFSIPPLTSIEQQPEEIGRQAVMLACRRLSAMAQKETVPYERILIPSQLVQRASCTRPRVSGDIPPKRMG